MRTPRFAPGPPGQGRNVPETGAELFLKRRLGSADTIP